MREHRQVAGPDGSRLSPRQHYFLVVLLAEESRPDRLPFERGWGLAWRHEGGRTRSESAADSRALRRLEARGLVLRGNIHSGIPGYPHGIHGSCLRSSHLDPHNRTSHVRLTDAGRAVAKRLTSAVARDVNRLAEP